ncbi:MAG: pyruvate dehydrogenase (acetyl-transferring), homodimeric type, partial [Acidimicrobiales bacterium]|nr:pyruvate dehydrogenase (acetyl-transferring), homodimeric type [Acidimicrobiales bacterium]
SGKPTAILAKTVKGWDLGKGIEARNAAHAVKQMKAKDLIELRDRLGLEQYVSNEALKDDLPPYIRPSSNSPEISYLLEHRHDLGGFLPKRNLLKPKPELNAPSLLDDFVEGSNSQLVSTTGVMARIIRNLSRDQEIGKRIVPIVPDEGRSFGLESLFSEIGIYAPFGQHYVPVDADLILKYRESSTGQILEEGITEAGSMASFIAASTSCVTFGEPIIPFFMFYSMFGFQRIGDLIWALGDIRGKGFLVGTTAGRTTYAGEGLQHEDGHSHLTALSYPAIVSFDPSFAYELAIIVEHGIADMYGPNQRDVSYYITTYNEAYPMPKIPEHLQVDQLKKEVISGIYKYSETKNEKEDSNSEKVAIWFSGPLGPVAIRAGEILINNYEIESEMWSLTSVKQLRQDALEADSFNRTRGSQPEKISRIEEVCDIIKSPILTVTDYVRSLPDLLGPWINCPFITLGTDGFGLSDSRPDLRAYFQIDETSIVIAALRSLERYGEAESLFNSHSEQLGHDSRN